MKKGKFMWLLSGYPCCDIRLVRKLIFGELLTKQVMIKKRLYTRNTYTRNIILNVVTARIETIIAE
jgi:hypothetical protein